MTLVKLASQPPVLPIEEALAQLEALSRQLAGGNVPERGEKPEPRAVVPPTTATVQEETPPVTRSAVTSSSVAETDQDGTWERFLAAVQKEKISLFFALRTGRLLNLTSTTLQIAVDKDPYFRDLTRKESRTVLEEIARRFFGRTLTVEVTKSGQPSTLVAPLGPSAAQPQDSRGENDPLVKTVLDILGGAVQTTTRSYRSPG